MLLCRLDLTLTLFETLLIDTKFDMLYSVPCILLGPWMMPVLLRTDSSLSPCQWRVFPDVFWPCVRRGKNEAKISRTVKVATVSQGLRKGPWSCAMFGLERRLRIVPKCSCLALPWSDSTCCAQMCVRVTSSRRTLREATRSFVCRSDSYTNWRSTSWSTSSARPAHLDRAALTTTIDQHPGLPEHGPQGRLRGTGFCPDPIAPAQQRDLHRALTVQVRWRGEPW